MARPPPDVGDPAPWFSATSGVDASTVAFDELAGLPTLLFLFGSAGDPAIAAALAGLDRCREIFDGKRALFLGVSCDPDDFKLGRLHDDAGHMYLLDGNRVAPRQFGVAMAADTPPASAVRATAFLLSAAHQILAILPFDEPEAFAQRRLSLMEKCLSSAPRSQTPPVLVVPNVFDPSLCRRLIDLYDAAGGREIGAIEYKGQMVTRADLTYRQRLDYYVADDDTLQKCREMLERRLLPLVYRAFQFPTTRIERYLVGCYDAVSGGFFRPHRDNTAPPVAHRRFALSILLNDEYEGGELRFPEFGDQTFRLAPGEAIVFSCALLHEVTTVTSGRRYAFISFLYDEASQRIRDAYVKQQG
jgi:predicted 2-oxoglutarate/Fe(II)-dependent dioxygenase YbiX